MAECAQCATLVNQTVHMPPHGDLKAIGTINKKTGKIELYRCQVCDESWQRFSSAKIFDDLIHRWERET